jgi:hypothetical protein
MADAPAPPPPDDDEDLPVTRDYSFLVKLVVALALGVVAAALIGWKLQSVAAGCGSSLVRPGGTVIPREQPSPR